MPFWGPLIAGAAGAWFALHLQDREWRHDRDHARRDWEAAAASKLFDQVSGAIKERMLRMRDLRDCIRDEGANSALIEEKWRAHRAAQRTWNGELSFNVVQVEQFFGLATCRLIDRADPPEPGELAGIAQQFTELDVKLSAYFHEHESSPERFGPEWHEDWDQRELELRQSVAALSRVMLTTIQRGMVEHSSRTLLLLRSTSRDDEQR